MTTTETLAALAAAWVEGEPGAGSALHDAMEETGWPWRWSYSTPTLSLSQCLVGGVPVAEIWIWTRLGLLPWRAAVREAPVGGIFPTAPAARAAAEAALRRALRGE